LKKEKFIKSLANNLEISSNSFKFAGNFVITEAVEWQKRHWLLLEESDDNVHDLL